MRLILSRLRNQKCRRSPEIPRVCVSRQRKGETLVLVANPVDSRIDTAAGRSLSNTLRSTTLNILDLLKGQLGDGLAGQLGGMLGEPEEKTKGAMDGMLGSILGSILGKASTPGGAEELSREVDKHDGGILDSIGDIFGNNDRQKEVADSGGGILGSLLGDKLGGVGDLIGKASGMKSGSILSMLGMLAPLVMGFLGKMKKTQGLDSGGFATMLMSQKDNIGAAMPEGMSNTLGLSDGLFSKAAGVVSGAAGAVGDAAGATAGAVGDAAGAAAGAVGNAAGAVGDAAGAAAGAAGDAAEAGGNLLKALLPLIVLGVLGWFGYTWWQGRNADEDANTDGGAIAGDAMAGLPAMPEIPKLDGLGEVGTKFTDLFKNTESTLSGITDVESAKTAATRLGELTTGMDGLTDGFGALPDATKTGFISHITGQLLPRLTGVIDKVKGIPGVGAIIQPAIDAMLEKLKGFTG